MTINGTSGDDILNGTAGDDEILGLEGNDTISGNAGDDNIRGNEGDDTIYGGEGNDDLHGGQDNDELWGNAGNDYIWGGLGNDLIYGGTGDDWLYGGDGDDVIWDGTGGGEIDGGAGVDTIVYQNTQSARTINLSTSTATSTLGELQTLYNIENVIGSNLADMITGDAGNNHLEGRAGDDHIWGGFGNDHIWGGLGKDHIYGGTGDDWLYGGDGDDVIWDGTGGGEIDGGAGVDTIVYQNTQSARTINLSTSTATSTLGELQTLYNIENVIGSNLADIITGDSGNNHLEGADGADIIYGGNGNDILRGNTAENNSDYLADANDGDDKLYGGAGDDVIYGNQADDELYGGDGNDILAGGRQNDYLDGGNGIDTALYHLRNSSEFQITKNNDGTVTVTHSLGYLEAGTDILVNVEKIEFDDQIIDVDYNDTPTAVHLNNTIVNENVPAGSLVGLLSTTDADSGDTHSYTLSGADAASFQISGNQLLFASGVSPDFEQKSTYSVTVTSTDPYSASVSNSFTINISDINEAPTDINLTNSNIDENAQAGTVVGILSADNPEVSDTLTYIITNDPSGFFEIVGNELRVSSSAALDYETATSHNITVQVSDGTNTYLEGLTIQVNDIDPEPIYGTSGDDILAGTSGDDTIFGLAGDDQLDGGFGNDWLYGGDGNDILIGGLSADHMFAGAGDDIVYYTDGDYFFENGQANDVGGSGYDTLIIESGSIFNTANISIYGFEAFQGAEQNDNVEGRDGTVNYNFSGNAGDDTLTGNAGNDTLNGGIGNDWLYGGDGNDILIGGLSADHMFAGAGDDIVYYTDGDFFFENGQANDVGGAGRDTLVIEAGNFYSTSNISLYGFEIFQGAELNDSIEGRDATINYEFYGNGGNDTLTGDDGNDILAGGIGSDALTGGLGNDTFIFTSGDGQDSIQDFSAGAASDDVIELSGISGVTSFNDVLTSAYQSGSDTVIDFGNNDTLTLVGVDKATLHNDDFAFV